MQTYMYDYKRQKTKTDPEVNRAPLVPSQPPQAQGFVGAWRQRETEDIARRYHRHHQCGGDQIDAEILENPPH